MSGRPAKKQKVTEPLPAPIILKAAGMKCDTRLLVFRQEYQVHSMVLKLHSTFFQKFMDSSEKKDYVPQDGWQYNYTTFVDEDGKDWYLAPANDYKNPTPYNKYKGDCEGERALFEDLLCAFYAKPYTIICIDELSVLTKFADYYCCLRILSNTTNGAILANRHKDEWYEDIEKDPVRVMEIATKLRNSMLFQDALIFAVSCWETPHQICIQNWVHSKLLSECAGKAGSFVGEQLTVPQYFRLIREHKNVSSQDRTIELDNVLSCELAFPIEVYKADKRLMPINSSMLLLKSCLGM